MPKDKISMMPSANNTALKVVKIIIVIVFYVTAISYQCTEIIFMQSKSRQSIAREPGAQVLTARTATTAPSKCRIDHFQGQTGSASYASRETAGVTMVKNQRIICLERPDPKLWDLQ